MQIEFNREEFREIYPQYQHISDKKLEESYKFALLLHRQTARREYVEDKEIAKSLLNLLLSHILGLEERGDRLVGTLSSASEGSVATSFSLAKNEKSAWFCQSQSGASYYQLVHTRNYPRYYSGK